VSGPAPAWARAPSRDPPGTRDPREAAAVIAEALRQVFGQHLQAVLLKGSVLKGDVLPFFSDLDVHALVRGIGPGRAPPWSQAVAFQTHVGPLDPEAYGLSAFQVTFLDADRPDEPWVPPWPGTYEVLAGSMPAPGAVDATPYLQQAEAGLRALPRWAASVVRSFVDKPDRALPRHVRLAGAYLKGALYDAAIVLTRDPGPVLTARLPELVALVGPATRTTEVLEALRPSRVLARGPCPSYGAPGDVRVGHDRSRGDHRLARAAVRSRLRTCQASHSDGPRPARA
jgi:hypothetical protein